VDQPTALKTVGFSIWSAKRSAVTLTTLSLSPFVGAVPCAITGYTHRPLDHHAHAATVDLRAYVSPGLGIEQATMMLSSR
jgi:hypothetical protein